MEDIFFSILDSASHAMSNKHLIFVAAIGVLFYISLVLVFYFRDYAAELTAEKELFSILQKHLKPSEQVRAIAHLSGAKIDESDFSNSTDANSISEPDQGRHQSVSVRTKKIRASRVGQAVGSLLGCYVTIDQQRHIADGIIPTKNFLSRNDPGASVDVGAFFDTLVRLSLLATFAGVAAVLYLAGSSLGNVSGANIANNNISPDAAAIVEQELSQKTDRSTSDSPPNLMREVLGIISASSNKFWITVFGYGGGNLMLIVFQIFEDRRTRRMRLFSVELDKLLETQEATSFIRNSGGDLLTKEKRDVMRALTKNIEELGGLAKSVNDDLIGNISSMLIDNKKNLDAVVENIKSSYEEINKKGVYIPIQSSLSNDIHVLLNTIVSESTRNSAAVTDLHRLLEQWLSAQKTPRRPARKQSTEGNDFSPSQ